MFMYNSQLVSFSIEMLLAGFDDYYTIRKQYIDLPKDRNNYMCCLIKDGRDWVICLKMLKWNEPFIKSLLTLEGAKSKNIFSESLRKTW